ncbi:hypothetical protein WG66_000112, partial [Moniliophthora roreri]
TIGLEAQKSWSKSLEWWYVHLSFIRAFPWILHLATRGQNLAIVQLKISLDLELQDIHVLSNQAETHNSLTPRFRSLWKHRNLGESLAPLISTRNDHSKLLFPHPICDGLGTVDQRDDDFQTAEQAGCVVASGFLLLYDVLLSFGLEFEHIWKSKWSFFKILYLIQRYLPGVDTVIALPYHDFGTNFTQEACQSAAQIAVICFRVRAIWGNGKTVTVVLGILLLGCWIPAFVFLEEWLSSLRYLILPVENFRGCILLSANNLMYRSWVMMMVFDTVTLILTLIPGISAYRVGGRSKILITIYRDVASVVNVLAVLMLPSELGRVLASFERVLHSILTSRAVLHIRQVASEAVYLHEIPVLEVGTGAS